MKDYSLNKESKKKFILDYYIANDQTITVVFADGTHFEGLENTEENLAIIEAAQEKQARRALANMPVFKRKAIAAGLGSAVVTGAAMAFGCFVLCDLLGVPNEPVSIFATTGATTLVGFIPTFIRANKAVDKVEELNKIKYRDEHREELDSYLEHPNALAGVEHKNHFTYCADHDIDPYSVLSIDSFTQADLEKIVENVERQNNYGFTYQKGNSK